MAHLKKSIGRGTSCCDFDQDGGWDLLVSHQHDNASLLQNDSKSGNFLKLSFVGTKSNRTGIGTQVTVTAGKKKFFHELVAGTSYVSSNQPSLIFGLGEFNGECEVKVRWPSGEVETFENVSASQAMILVENS